MAWHIQSTPVLLPGKSHGWRSLVGCSPWGHEESDMTEQLHFHFSLLCIGEGNGNPLQCSCPENPRDVVTESHTQFKWLSSSRSIQSTERKNTTKNLYLVKLTFSTEEEIKSLPEQQKVNESITTKPTL